MMTKLRPNRKEIEPALTPLAPAFFRPFFLMIKLVPIKMLEETARMTPWTLSGEIPIGHTRERERWNLAGPRNIAQSQLIPTSIKTHQIRSQKTQSPIINTSHI